MSDNHRLSESRELPVHDSGPDKLRGISRREMVKYLGLLPLAGAVEWSDTAVARAATMVRGLQQQGAQPYAPKFFTADEWRTLNILVDYIIPRDAKSGSATDARVPEFIDFMLTDEEQNISRNVQNQWRSGLEWLDNESRNRFQLTFTNASDAQRRQILDDIAWPGRARDEMRAGVTFFNRARDMTAAGFFSSAIGWADLDYMGNTIVPEWTGCPEPALQKLGVSYDLMNRRAPIRDAET